MTILEQIDEIAANVPKMTIKRAKHFCDLYEALYIVICDFDDPIPMDTILLYKELKARIQKIRRLRNSITDYKTNKAVILDCAIITLKNAGISNGM